MTDENVSDTPTTYWRTGLLVIATAMPAVVWGAKQVFAGASNAINGKDNSSPEED